VGRCRKGSGLAKKRPIAPRRGIRGARNGANCGDHDLGSGGCNPAFRPKVATMASRGRGSGRHRRFTSVVQYSFTTSRSFVREGRGVVAPTRLCGFHVVSRRAHPDPTDSRLVLRRRLGDSGRGVSPAPVRHAPRWHPARSASVPARLARPHDRRDLLLALRRRRRGDGAIAVGKCGSRVGTRSPFRHRSLLAAARGRPGRRAPRRSAAGRAPDRR
jgi:hypothetical protein